MESKELHPVRFTDKQVGWIEHLIRREFHRVDTSEYLKGVCRSILFVIKESGGTYTNEQGIRTSKAGVKNV